MYIRMPIGLLGVNINNVYWTTDCLTGDFVKVITQTLQKKILQSLMNLMLCMICSPGMH